MGWHRDTSLMAGDCTRRGWHCTEEQRFAGFAAEIRRAQHDATGGCGKTSENSILSDNGEAALHADVLKVGHHGSKNSTMPRFLAAVHPSVAVISAGEENLYGHPNPELLERLTTAGVRILRTDRDGAVRVLTDGKNLEISCFVACPEKTAETASAQPQPPDQQQRREQ